MTYLDDLASEIQQHVPADLVPDADTALLFRLYAMLARVKGERVTAADVHDAWSVWMAERDPRHRSLKPFGELDKATQASDEPYVEAIRTAAAQLRS
jgi:hypothetical protein